MTPALLPLYAVMALGQLFLDLARLAAEAGPALLARGGDGPPSGPRPSQSAGWPSAPSGWPGWSCD